MSLSIPPQPEPPEPDGDEEPDDDEQCTWCGHPARFCSCDHDYDVLRDQQMGI